jgi:hypothetical protein
MISRSGESKRVLKKSWPLHWLSLIAITAIVLANLLIRSTSFPFSVDSASYIEMARTLAMEGAALVSPYGLEGNHRAPSSLFPIGFPLFLSLFQLAGIDGREASVALNWISSLALPLVFYLGFRSVLGDAYALVVALLSISTPGFIIYSGMGLADIFSLLIAGASIGFLINANSSRLAIVAGILAGVAYSVRNAHIALLASVAVYFVLIWIIEKQDRRELRSTVVWFLVGATAIVVPLIVRNLIVFGEINPYSMEPSTIGLLENSRTYLREFVYDITGHRNTAVVAQGIPGLVVVTGLLCSIAWMAMLLWDRLDTKQRRTLLLCSVYSFIGACVVVAARSRYQWGESINIRHTLQYAPFFFVAFAMLASASAKHYHHLAIKYVPSIALFAIVITHGLSMVISGSHAARIERANAAVAAYEGGKEYLCKADDNGLLVSNYAYVFRIMCDSPVRHWSPEIMANQNGRASPEYVVASLLALAESHSNERMTVWLHPERDVRRGLGRTSFPIAVGDSSRLRIAGWDVVVNNHSGLLISR